MILRPVAPARPLSLYCADPATPRQATAMSTISIAKKHHYSHKKAKDVAEKIAKDLKRRFALDYAWEGDHVEFERPGVTGRMMVGKDRIALDVRLGFLLTPLKGAIEREIHAQLDKLIVDDKPANAPAAQKRPPRKKS
jgi:putative polyhydroxyalkanoate system protein